MPATPISLTDSSEDLTPVSRTERIQALDVVRGFAVIGIFLMNVEFYNRPLNELGQGLPATMTGANWLAGWLIYIFIQGKFWTMFSLLFGMGFAVMLTRAERADRNFLRPYLRRIAALAVFGALHHIFIWGGDILFSYAVAAVGFLILLYGNWKTIAIATLALFGTGFLPGFEPLQQIAGSLAFISVAALFLRGEWEIDFLGRRLLVFSMVCLILGALMTLGTLALWLMPDAPKDPRVPMTVMTVVVLAIGLLSAKFHDPLEPRSRRLGVAMYLFPFLMMTTFGAVQYFSPPKPAVAATASVAQTKPDSSADAKASARASSAAGVKAGTKAAKTEAEKSAERKAEREKRQKKHQQEIAKEARILTQGSYLEAVKLRASEFAEKAPGKTGFATIIIGMFLLGAWFVRSGVMENTAAHLPLFRKLALYGLPVGIGLGLLGSSIATARTPGLDGDPYEIAAGLMLIGNLPACLGYVSLIVLMLHSGTALAKINVLAPIGRMALTNYLIHSIVGTLFFYGYGLGYWGMDRAWQVLFVAVVIALQLVFCHRWLARFRYGPMEWLWRAITYWRLPPMRREQLTTVDGRQLSA